MKHHSRSTTIPALALGVFVLCASTVAVHAAVITSDPSLPTTAPNTGYLTPAQVHAEYMGPGLDLILSQAIHQPFAGTVVRTPQGPNEMESFNSGLSAMLSVNGSPNQPTTATGPVVTEVFGKGTSTTGTFNTEMLQLNLSGNSPFGPFMIRESPTLQSTGQTSITDIGGGLYQIDSFFDIFTELSVDGGATWIPSSNGPAHVQLEDLSSVPEPGTLAWGAALGLAAAFRRTRARRA